MTFVINKERERSLKKVISRYNSKAKRLLKKGNVNLPSLANYEEITSRISNRWDYVREIEYLETFISRGGERIIETSKGAKITRSELEILTREQKRLYNKLSREIKRLGESKPHVLGVIQDETYVRMGDVRITNLKAKRKYIRSHNILNMGTSDISKLRKVIFKTRGQLSNEKWYYDNFINFVLEGSGLYTNYDAKKLEYIKEKLRELGPKKFFKLYESEESFRTLRYLYDNKDSLPNRENKTEISNIIDAIYENIDAIVKDFK